NVDAADAVALDQRLDALAATVCDQDPRTREQRRADAIGPLARLQAHLSCRCGRDDCPAAQTRAAADAAMLHLLAEQATVEGTSNAPGYLLGYGIVPAETVRNLAAHAKIKPLRVPNGQAQSTDPAGPTEPAA
ncbi:DUF222 domain-containing protein, partial [Mycolicibacterium houstonense]|uniref:DUF222 domain-containing protein n=1 Tax=Mycolicibacterium houstonense TaxID=146021 RepID=UPI003F94CFF0